MTQCEQAIATYPPAKSSRIFDLWAQVYDAQSNPLLALEERHTLPLLPRLTGCDVLDVGCGTGRWLRMLAELGPATLTGTDCSAGMLHCAREKVGASTQLLQSEGPVLPCDTASMNVLLASFVLSYLDDLHAFARECHRVIRPGGWVVISDMHPATAAERDWKRSFNVDGTRLEVQFSNWPIEKIIGAFQQHDFKISTLLEPAFGAPERVIFESTGKLFDFDNLIGTPAIYILKLQKKSHSDAISHHPVQHVFQLRAPRIASGPTTWRNGNLRIEGEQVTSIGEEVDPQNPSLDLSGYCVLPGLINAHDHLEFGLYPNLGRTENQHPYQNSAQWAQEIHTVNASTIALHQRVPKSTRLWWGAIRNLLCGVTTVCHHNPLYPEFRLHDFPVHVVSEFGWSHSLQFDPHLEETFRRTPPELPFIIHASEGLDPESRDEISQLDLMQVLDDRTVLIHGLGIGPGSIALINQRGCSLVTCPTSNAFLFGRTLSRDLLNSVQRLAIGGDSSLTATGDLLDEIIYLRCKTGIDANLIYSMVTSNPAEMLRLPDTTGHIVESGTADLIAVSTPQHATPAAVLTHLTFERIEMVLLSGKVQLASQAIYEQLHQHHRSGLQCLDVAGHLRWLRAPLQSLFNAAESVLGKGKLLISGRQVRYVESL